MHGKFPVPGTGDLLVRSLNSIGVLFSELLLLLTVCKSKYDIRFSKSLKAVKSIYDECLTVCTMHVSMMNT